MRISRKRLAPPQLRQQLGERIRTRRVALGISQKEMSKRLNTSQTILCHLERGYSDCTVFKLHRISVVLNTNISTLLEGLL